jgi:hypothetical protein
MECGGKPRATPLWAEVASVEKRRRRCALPARSKTWRRFVASLVFVAAAIIASAQQYSIDWHKVAGGGGTSTNGQYSVSGTIGQADAGSMSGGNYALQGGFWGVVAAVPSPGAPPLTITPTGPNVIVSWPSPSTGFGLQENLGLDPGTWSAVPPTNSDNGTIKSIVVPAGPGNRFYRLKR